MDLADRAKLEDDAGRVRAARRDHRKVLVRGPTGSGRGQVLAALRREDPSLIAVEAPPLSDADAPVHPLFAAATELGPNAVEAVTDGRSLEDRALALASCCVHAGRTLALRLPSSWRYLGTAATDPDRRIVAERADRVLRTLGNHAELRLVVFAEPGLSLDFRAVRLEPMQAKLQALEPSAWGTYSVHALELARAAGAAHVEMTPVQARLAVGLLGLGEPVGRVLDAIRFAGTVSSSLQMLENRLVAALRHQPTIAAGIMRIALARFGLPRSKALWISRLPAEHEPLVTECLAYGDEQISMHDRLRAVLTSSQAATVDLEDAHHVLATHHRTLDGTVAIGQSPSPRDWLERVFHLGLSGDRGNAEWSTLELPSREMYWTRGRALSRAGRYAEAAAIYRQCIGRFEDDDYAAHYQAVNRDRDGIGDAETENLYRRAVELRADNAWWNARLVTFLIERARFIAAREEWRNAVKRVDPDGEGGTWLALHFHRWVVAAWLDQGEVELARQAFDAIPDDILPEDVRLRELAQRLGDVEEAQRMGHSVYPSSVPIGERWRAPRGLPSHSSGGASRVAWYPARVVESDDRKVLLAIGVPPTSTEDRPRTALKEFDLASWRRFARTTDAAEGFWQLGTYADGEVQAVAVAAVLDHAPASSRDSLRFAKRWIGTQSS